MGRAATRPKVTEVCNNCKVEGEHYQRPNGKTVRPCCRCMIQRVQARQDAIREDPTKLDRQRDIWASQKRRQRRIERGEVATEGHRDPATGRPLDRPEWTPPTEAPSPPQRRRRRPSRHRRRPARPTNGASMEAGFD